MTYYSMVGGKDLSVSSVDLQCTCHFSIQNLQWKPEIFKGGKPEPRGGECSPRPP